MRRALAVVLAVACGSACRKPAEKATARTAGAPSASHDAARRVAGDRISYRFVDHAGEATVTSPSLSEAWRASTYPAKVVDPYNGLRGDDVWRVVEVALADADVASYGTPHPIAPAK